MTFDDFRLDKTGDGLLPVIVQDATTLRVLMLGYMNREAFDLTCERRRVTFYSRSRRSLWLKGESSGNFLEVDEMLPDCDFDTLLIKARPAGPTCHRGTTSCFDTDDSEGFVRSLSRLIADRHRQMPDDSYTTRLFVKGVKKIAQKVGEEAVETVVEAVDATARGSCMRSPTSCITDSCCLRKWDLLSPIWSASCAAATVSAAVAARASARADAPDRDCRADASCPTEERLPLPDAWQDD